MTALPSRPTTAAYTSTTFTPEVNCPSAGLKACAADAARNDAAMPATRVKMVEFTCPRHLKGRAMIGRLGLPELAIILVIIILIFGANRLPEIGRGIGKGIRNFKESTKEGSGSNTHQS